MRSLAISKSDALLSLMPHESIGRFELAGEPLVFCLLQEPSPDFDVTAPANRYRVLVRKRAFSCNYRDKGLIFNGVKSGYKHAYVVIGSEFSGDVVAIGSEVTGFRVGDRVMGDNHYIGGNPGGEFEEGVPTNAASKEYQTFHQAKLIGIPPEMTYEIAASFSIGAQTSYSMARKLDLVKGARVLVTAAKSNTALCTISALRKHDVEVYASTTSPRFEQELQEMGVRELFHVDSQVGLARVPRIQSVAREIGGFDGVVDPFFDLHLGSIMSVMAPGGRYVTCGWYDQYLSLIGKQSPYENPSLLRVIMNAMLGNVQIIGNCLGLTRDLERAITDFMAGDFKTVIDSVHSFNREHDFLHRSFDAPDRFGKVIYRYD